MKRKKEEFHSERELYQRYGLRTEFNHERPIPIRDDHLLHNESLLGEGDYTCVKQMIYASALESPEQKQIIMSE